MGAPLAVKTRLIVVAALCLSCGGRAEPAPDAHEILRTVRAAQASQHQMLQGRLRTGGRSVPFRLVINGPIIRYEFSDPPQTIQLRLQDRSSRLEEITRGGSERVSAARLDAKVRGTDISYEDLALKFLYWPRASVQGEQTMLLRKCWKVAAEPASRDDSQYSRVMLWVEKESGALLQAEAFDDTGRLAKRFKVVSGQKINGLWFLKQMRIEAPAGAGSKDRTPTYLEIQAGDR